jgi:hypothetical protein
MRRITVVIASPISGSAACSPGASANGRTVRGGERVRASSGMFYAGVEVVGRCAVSRRSMATHSPEAAVRAATIEMAPL